MGKIGFAAISHPDYTANQTISMYNAVKKLAENIGHQIIYYDNIITSDSDARKAGLKFRSNDVDGYIVFLNAWIECSTATSLLREMEGVPLCIMACPMMQYDGKLSSTGSYVSYTMYKGVLDRIGITYKGIIGIPDDDKTLKKLKIFASAAEAHQRLKRSRIGLVGYASMGIYTGTFDHTLLRFLIGPEIEHIDTYTLLNQAEGVPETELTAATQLIRAIPRHEGETNSEKDMKAARLYLSIKKLCRERSLGAINIKCQYELSREYGMAPCVPLALVADEGIVSSCEGDIMCTVSMMILKLLGGGVPAYGDSINHEGNILKLSPCGFMPFSLGVQGKQKIRSFRENQTICGYLCNFVMRPGRITVLRLVEDIGGYHIVYCTGEGLESELRNGMFPCIDIRLDGNMESLLENYSGQHYAVCYSDLSEKIEDLARILKIKTIRI